MSRRSILNITSVKKRNDMINIASVATENGVIVGTAGTTQIQGSVGGTILWCATAQPLAVESNQESSAYIRTAETCYIRGLKETIDLRTNNGEPWQWRRIVFSFKVGQDIDAVAPIHLVGPNGPQRLALQSRNSLLETNVLNAIFKGDRGIDWTSAHTAAIDTQRVHLHSDSKRHITSGNTVGTIRTHKRWYPFNKNLHYDNEQQGNRTFDTVRSRFARQSIGGMGDVYIMDFFDCNDTNSANVLRFNAEATLYWHER